MFFSPALETTSGEVFPFHGRVLRPNKLYLQMPGLLVASIFWLALVAGYPATVQVCWLDGWLAGWLATWVAACLPARPASLIGWLAARAVGWIAGWLAGWLTR